MRSVSFKALIFGSQFAESWSSMAQLPSFSAALETVVEGPSGSGSVSMTSWSSPVSVVARGKEDISESEGAVCLQSTC